MIILLNLICLNQSVDRDGVIVKILLLYDHLIKPDMPQPISGQGWSQ